MHPSSSTTTSHNQFLQKRTRDESIIYPAPESKRPKPDTSQSQPQTKSNLAPHQQYTQILNQAYTQFTYSSSRNPIPNPNSNSIYTYLTYYSILLLTIFTSTTTFSL